MKQSCNDASLSSASQYPKLTKLKIVGNGMNSWSVATSGPFYLVDLEPLLSAGGPQGAEPSSSQPLTGATNLITHYGLLSTYHKFCGKPFKESLGSFLPSIPGNLDKPATQEEIGLMSLLQKPPVQKEISTFSSNSLNEAFRLYKGPAPTHAYYFTNETPHMITTEEKNKHKSENRKKRRRESTVQLKVPNLINNDINSIGQNLTCSNIDSSQSSAPIAAASISVHDGQSLSISYTPKSISVGETPSLIKVPSTATNVSSSQSQSPALLTSFTIKTKKSKKSDDEKKKKKKEKKKKKDRMLD